MTKTREAPGKQKIVLMVPDVHPFEALAYDHRLPDPQFVFAGMVPIITSGLVQVNQDPAHPPMRPSFNAIFLVPFHLASDPKIMDIGRATPQVVEVPDEAPEP